MNHEVLGRNRSTIYIRLTENANRQLAATANTRVVEEATRWLILHSQSHIARLNDLRAADTKSPSIHVNATKTIPCNGTAIWAVSIYYLLVLNHSAPNRYTAIIESVTVSAINSAPAPQPAAPQPTIAPWQVGAAQMPQRPVADPGDQRREMAPHHRWALDGLRHRR
ncbi:MAG: hypothetical protein LBI39_02695 [Puniceicoccales bacterium]|jgi:hypothetical protein|nr:hypothetical protein [Puniceicoccales bacterium]